MNDQRAHDSSGDTKGGENEPFLMQLIDHLKD